MALMSIPRTTDSFYQPHSIQTTLIESLVIWRQTAAILASSARASPCRRARRGATQPASARMRTPAKSSADGLFQPEVEALSRHPRGPTSFTIGCVNFGFQQSMMEGKRQCTYNLGCEAVCTKIVYDGDCDILFGCEVGAHGKGLAAANIELDDILRNPFGERVCCDWAQNYVTAWNFFGARHDNMTKRRESQIHTVPGTRNVRATVSRFDVKKDKHDTVHVISGNMHIVCATKAPSLQARRKAVKALADCLDSFVPDSDMPVARTVRGDNNFLADEVRQAVQLVTRNELAWTGAQPGASGSGASGSGRIWKRGGQRCYVWQVTPWPTAILGLPQMLWRPAPPPTRAPLARSARRLLFSTRSCRASFAGWSLPGSDDHFFARLALRTPTLPLAGAISAWTYRNPVW